MQRSQKTAVAVHLLLCLAQFRESCKLTSDFLAGSTGVNPVIVRTLLGRLKAAGLVNVPSGVGGASLAREPEAITLLDIFRAVEGEADLFALHKHPNPACPVGRVIVQRLEAPFSAAKRAFESSLATVTLADLLPGT